MLTLIPNQLTIKVQVDRLTKDYEGNTMWVLRVVHNTFCILNNHVGTLAILINSNQYMVYTS